jgi:hypothetical protein
MLASRGEDGDRSYRVLPSRLPVRLPTPVSPLALFFGSLALRSALLSPCLFATMASADSSGAPTPELSPGFRPMPGTLGADLRTARRDGPIMRLFSLCSWVRPVKTAGSEIRPYLPYVLTLFTLSTSNPKFLECGSSSAEIYHEEDDRSLIQERK